MSSCAPCGTRIYPIEAEEMSGDQIGKLIGPIVLEDQFVVHPKSSQYHVTLTRNDVTLTPLSSSRRRTSGSGPVPGIISLKDVTGCLLMRNRDKDVNTAYFCIYYYPYRKKILGKRIRHRQTITFAVNSGTTFKENKKRATEWKMAIQVLLKNHDDQERRHYLVLLNPCSGTGKGLQIYQNVLKPMFMEAELDYEMLVTERANHARDIMKDLPLSKFDGVIILSGDGLIHEVLNGLMARTDWEQAVKFPIGILPVGSGNALAASINFRAGLNDMKRLTKHDYDGFDNLELIRIWRESYTSRFTQHSAYILLKHVVSPMDLMLVQTETEKLTCFLSVAWGLTADVDIESEKYRKLGSVRFIVGALKRIMILKTYRGRLSFLPDKPYVSRQRSKTHNGQLQRSTTSEDVSSTTEPQLRAKSESLPELAFRSRSQRPVSQYEDDSPDENLENIQDSNQDENSNTNHASNLRVAKPSTKPPCQATSNIPPLSEPVPSDWVILEEDYIMITAVSVSHLSIDFISHPDILWNDGLITLCVIRAGTSKPQLLSILTAMEDGTHINNDHMEFIRCHAFRIEPLDRKGYLAVDGEFVETGPIQAEVLKSCARIMSAPET